MSTYGFIGAGNMGGALIRAAVKSKPAKDIFFTDKAKEKAQATSAETGAVYTDIQSVAEKCDYIFIGVKPQILSDMFSEISGTLAKRTSRFVLVSMVAGVTVEGVRKAAGGDYPVIRIMPNLPAAYGAGMIVYTTDAVTDEEENDFLSSMSYAGKFDRSDEKLIDAASAISGCGPAFAFMFAEALADGGVACGLPREKANIYAAQMLLGSAKMLLESGKHPGALKDAVCSPAGSTIAGVITLEEAAFRAAISDAVIASFERTKELGK